MTQGQNPQGQAPQGQAPQFTPPHPVTVQPSAQHYDAAVDALFPHPSQPGKVGAIDPRIRAFLAQFLATNVPLILQYLTGGGGAPPAPQASPKP